MRDRQRTRWEDFLGRLDKRYVYLGLLGITLLPLITRWSLPLYLTAPPERFAETIESLPQDRLVLITSNWDAGTQAESRPQMVAVVRHLIRRNLRFAIVSIGYPTSPQLADIEVRNAIRLEGAEDRWKYGQQWVNLGYKFSDDPWLRSFSRDIQDALHADWKGTPFRDLPVIRNVRRFGPDGEISAVIDLTGSNTIEKWYEFLSPSKVKLLLACTAVMAPEQYPYLDSGQLSGLLTGMKGAAEYEKIINAPGRGTPLMGGQSFAHLYILILIVMGNLSILVETLRRRRRRRPIAGGTAHD